MRRFFSHEHVVVLNKRELSEVIDGISLKARKRFVCRSSEIFDDKEAITLVFFVFSHSGLSSRGELKGFQIPFGSVLSFQEGIFIPRI